MTIKFKYKALTANGDKVADYIYAVDQKSARLELKSQSLVVIELVLADRSATSFLSASTAVSATDIEQSTNQLATLLENGLRINKALEVLIETSGSQAASDLWRSVHSDVQSGGSLSEALRKFPTSFDLLYLEMSNIAENTGNLPQVFRSLADNLAFQRDLRNKTIQALAYPMIIFVVCITAVFAIFNFVIPNMESVFASSENLPGYTQWLLDSSRFVSHNNLLILVMASGLIALLVTLWKQPKTKQSLLAFIAGMPWLGKMFDKAEQIRFCSAMSLTLQSGLSLSDALSLSIKTLSIAKNKQQLEQVLSKVDTGTSLTNSLLNSHFLDHISLSLINVGEQSGTLEHSFIEVTKRSKTDFEAWMMKMTSLLEPLLILVMGAIVGGVVVVMLLSIVSVNDLTL